MNINEDGRWPHGWHNLDGDRCIKCHLLWSRVQRLRNASRPQEGTRDNRNDSAQGQATASIISTYGKLHGDIHPQLVTHGRMAGGACMVGDVHGMGECAWQGACIVWGFV